jgi:ATP-dependent HslUV protease ATP-binding subunit HslU
VPSSITVAGGLQGASAEVAKEDGTNQVIGAGPRRAGEKSSSRRERERFAALLSDKQLEDQIIEIEVGSESDGFDSVLEFSAGMSREEMNETFSEFMDSYSSISTRRRSRKVSVREARRILTREEANKLIDFDQVIDSAVQRVEETAVVFIDELDKVAGPKIDVGADVSGEGVQRDLLPIVEGTTVMTRYGPIKTDHILFIAAGTFFHSKPSDLIPEIQGRFPLRVELQPLSQKDFETILSQPVNALIKQYSALLETEGVELVYTPDGIAEMARVAVLMNDRLENIGARRLHTIVERVLEEVSFSASERKGEKIVIDRDFVAARLSDVIKDEDLSRYIL